MAARPTTRRQGTGRFDNTALHEIAGDALFSRGEVYAREGRVEILSGDGSCSCPAFTDHGFCKHLVATALAATAAADGGLPIPDRFDAVRAHLRSQGETRLIEMILDQADRDPALLDRLEIAASAAMGDPAASGKRLAGAPEVAVLGVACATRKIVDVAGQFVSRLMLPISLVYDHRVVDGAQGGRFMASICYRLAEPDGLAA
jgi:hypothetical protein